jgi:sulfur carrier protein
MIIFVNGKERDVNPPVTLAEVLDLGGTTPRGVAVAVDGVVVPRTRHAATVLDDGSRVEVVTAVQGG